MVVVGAILATLAFSSSAIAQSESATEPQIQDQPSPLLFLLFVGGASVVSLFVLRRRGVLRSGGLDTKSRDWAGIGALVWLAAAASIYVATYFGAISGLVISQQVGFEQNSLAELGLINVGTYAVSIVTAIVLILALRPASRRAGFVFSLRDCLVAPLIFMLVLPTIWLVSFASTEAAAEIARRSDAPLPEELGHETLRAMSDGSGIWWWVVTASVVFGAPIVEEIIYRGFLQTALRRASIPGWTTVIIVSVLFAGVHIGSADPWTLPSLFVLSLCLGASMELTGRVGVPILIHAIFNGVMLAIAEFAL